MVLKKTGDGRLSAAKQPGPDPAYVYGFRGVQYAYSSTGFIPFAWLGTYEAEDHRRSLRSGDEGKPFTNDTMDIGSHRERSLEPASRGAGIKPGMRQPHVNLQKFSYKLNRIVAMKF